MKELHFIKEIVQAVECDNPQIAIEKAIREILSLAHKPEFQQSYRQFIRFMELALKLDESDAVHQSSRIIDEYSETPIELIVERDGAEIATIPCPYHHKILTVRDVEPGWFVFKLNIGRLLWNGALTGQDLIWSDAFPGEGLKLAAETEELSQRAPRTIKLLKNELTIRTLPGIESGILEIEFNGPANE